MDLRMSAKIKRALKNIRKHKNPLRFILSRILPYIGISKILTIPREGYILKFHDSSMSKSLFADPKQNRSGLEVLNRLIEPGDIVLDIGANIGDYTISFSKKVGKNGCVYAFEPHPRTIKYLRENIILNRTQNVATAQVAVGSNFDWVTITDLRSDTINHISGQGGSIIVPSIKLDSFFYNTPISFLKVDTEGAEKLVFDGAFDLLSSVRCIVFEAKDSHYERFNFCFKDVFDLLHKHRFEVLKYKNGLAQYVHRESTFPLAQNLFACRDPHAFARALDARLVETPNDTNTHRE